jgi:energy-coupling factor transporter ATP-binding protein EcfA2
MLLNEPQGFTPTVQDPNEIFNNTNDRELEIGISVSPENTSPAKPHLCTLLRLTVLRNPPRCIAAIYSLREQISVSQPPSISFDNDILKSAQTAYADMSLIFRACDALSRAYYIGPFRNALNLVPGSNYYDIAIGQAFIHAWKELKTGSDKEQNERAVRLTEDIRKLLGCDQLEINSSPDDQTLRVMINGRSYALSELGSGISHFIIVMASVAPTHPSWILIDEPELNLHPSLQLDFLTTLGAYCREGVLFATHNIGLARAAGDQIYSVSVEREGSSIVRVLEDTPHLSECLGELSYSGYRELGYKKVLLVEGRTDVKTIQQLLRSFRKEHQCVLLPLGGSQLINGNSEIELAEVKRISEHVEALIDSERSSADETLAPERQAFVDVCTKLKIKCHVLARRAIENYFDIDAIRRVKGEKYASLKPYEILKTHTLPWAKEENWRIAREMKLESIIDTDLGAFLSAL